MPLKLREYKLIPCIFNNDDYFLKNQAFSFYFIETIVFKKNLS